MASRLPQIPVGALVAGLGAASTLGSVGYLAYNGIYSVKPGEKAIIFSRIWGVKEKVYSEGTHILIPWFEWPIIMDIRTRPRAIKSVTGTRGALGVGGRRPLLAHRRPDSVVACRPSDG